MINLNGVSGANTAQVLCERVLGFSWRIFNFGRCDIYNLGTKSSPIKSCCPSHPPPVFFNRPVNTELICFLSAREIKTRTVNERCFKGFISLFHSAPRSGNKHTCGKLSVWCGCEAFLKVTGLEQRALEEEHRSHLRTLTTENQDFLPLAMKCVYHIYQDLGL